MFLLFIIFNIIYSSIKPTVIEYTEYFNTKFMSLFTIFNMYILKNSEKNTLMNFLKNAIIAISIIFFHFFPLQIFLYLSKCIPLMVLIM